jgi:hypothetical protein
MLLQVARAGLPVDLVWGVGAGLVGYGLCVRLVITSDAR